MGIRCKMRLDNIFPNIYGGNKAIFRCQYDAHAAPEDVGFQKATPTGMAEYQIDNPEAIKQLVIGADYYVDFTRVPPPAPKVEQVPEKAS